MVIIHPHHLPSKHESYHRGIEGVNAGTNEVGNMAAPPCCLLLVACGYRPYAVAQDLYDAVYLVGGDDQRWRH